MNFITPERQAKLKELQTLTAEMDIPAQRRVFAKFFELNWFVRNLGIRNQNHPNFEKASALIKDLI